MVLKAAHRRYHVILVRLCQAARIEAEDASIAQSLLMIPCMVTTKRDEEVGVCTRQWCIHDGSSAYDGFLDLDGLHSAQSNRPL